MNDMVGGFFQEKKKVHDGLEISIWGERLYQIPEDPDLHPGVLNKAYEASPRGTGQLHPVHLPVHAVHGKVGIDAGTADNGHGVDVEDLDHAFLPVKSGSWDQVRDYGPDDYLSFIPKWSNGVMDYWSTGKHLT